ncbi:hypothetical protein IJ384_06760 [bacterium]|nr:hypothetical protein [bacterium]
MQIEQVNNCNTFKVNSNGAIEINSLKDTPLFEIAEKHDNKGINNDLLEDNELIAFLKDVKSNRELEQHLNVKENKSSYTYYEQHDENGNLLKKCLITKEEKDMMTFMYENNKPVSCICYKTNDYKYVMDLKTGKSTYFNTKTGHSEPYTLNTEQRTYLNRMGLDKPTQFPGRLGELAYRLFNWDWGDW